MGGITLTPDVDYYASAIAGRGELWLKQLDTGPFTRIFDGGSQTYRPFWSSDGRWIGFVSDVSGSLTLHRVASDGSGSVEPLTRLPRIVDEGLWSRDGVWLVFRAGSSQPGSLCQSHSERPA